MDRLHLQVIEGSDKRSHKLPGRDKGQPGAETAERHLGGGPLFMQDIDMEELQVGDGHVHGAVGKGAALL